MYVDEFRNFINDYDTGKLYIFFDYPTTYFSQEGARYLRSEWDMAKRDFILSFSSISIYNITQEKYEYILSIKDKLYIKNLKGEYLRDQDLLNYMFANLEIEKNAVLTKLYKDFSANKSLKKGFVPIYFIPQYFYTNKGKMSTLDTFKKNILDEFPGLNLYNLSNNDYQNINNKFKSKFGNFIESLKESLEKEKQDILKIFLERGSFKFVPSDDVNDIMENSCITSLNVYDAINYKPKNYSISQNTITKNKSSNDNSYSNFSLPLYNNKNDVYLNDNLDDDLDDDSDDIFNNSTSNNNIKKNQYNTSSNDSAATSLSNNDINNIIRLVTFSNQRGDNISFENIDSLCLQLGMEVSSINKIKSYAMSNPFILDIQNNKFSSYDTNYKYDTFESNNIDDYNYNNFDDEDNCNTNSYTFNDYNSNYYNSDDKDDEDSFDIYKSTDDDNDINSFDLFDFNSDNDDDDNNNDNFFNLFDNDEDNEDNNNDNFFDLFDDEDDNEDNDNDNFFNLFDNDDDESF